MNNQTTVIPETITDEELRMYRKGVPAKDHRDVTVALLREAVDLLDSLGVTCIDSRTTVATLVSPL